MNIVGVLFVANLDNVRKKTVEMQVIKDVRTLM